MASAVDGSISSGGGRRDARWWQKANGYSGEEQSKEFWYHEGYLCKIRHGIGSLIYGKDIRKRHKEKTARGWDGRVRDSVIGWRSVGLMWPVSPTVPA